MIKVPAYVRVPGRRRRLRAYYFPADIPLLNLNTSRLAYGNLHHQQVIIKLICALDPSCRVHDVTVTNVLEFVSAVVEYSGHDG